MTPMPETAKRYEWPELRRLAADLIQRYPELLAQVPPLSDILFVMDTESTPKSKGRPVLARVSKIPAKFEDFVYEGDKLFMLEWFKANNDHLTLNQKQVLMIHELLHFEYNHDDENPEHKLRGHDFEDFRILVETFGLNWASRTIGDIPDVMASDFTWGKKGQRRLDLSEHVDALAQAAAGAAPGHQVTVTAGGREATAKVEAPDSPPADSTPDDSDTGPDDWQPPDPYVPKSNVTPFPGPRSEARTGTDDVN